MSISRITYWMLQGNDVIFVDTAERSECWITHSGVPHALILSCPLDKRKEMEQFVADIKSKPEQELTAL